LFYHPDEKVTQTSELDKLSLAILEVLLGKKSAVKVKRQE